MQFCLREGGEFLVDLGTGGKLTDFHDERRLTLILKSFQQFLRAGANKTVGIPHPNQLGLNEQHSSVQLFEHPLNGNVSLVGILGGFVPFLRSLFFLSAFKIDDRIRPFGEAGLDTRHSLFAEKLLFALVIAVVCGFPAGMLAGYLREKRLGREHEGYSWTYDKFLPQILFIAILFAFMMLAVLLGFGP